MLLSPDPAAIDIFTANEIESSILKAKDQKVSQFF